MDCLAGDALRATRAVVVDDDPLVLATVRALLEREGIEVSTLEDPRDLTSALERAAPELLVLDVDMPEIDGRELCRVVRANPDWSRVAVVFLTVHRDPGTIRELFEAGADDYLTKPVVENDLLGRVANRLQRIRAHRAEADTDSLTGLDSRGRSAEGLAQLLSLGDRFAQPVSVAMLDMDRFKQVNDTFGHAAGDAVLRGLGERLRRDFRGNDVVGRWGGEECVIGMYGMRRGDGVRRLAETLRDFRALRFTAGRGDFNASFSAGIAEYPADGRDLESLLQAADEALYSAKQAGRIRVLAAGNGPPTSARVESRGEHNQHR